MSAKAKQERKEESGEYALIYLEFSSKWNPHVINLARRRDRMKEFQERWPFNSYNVKRVEAIDGKHKENISPFESLFNVQGKKLSDSAKACAISHYKIWRECEAKNRIFTIFEDDTFWAKDCLDIWNICQHTIPKDFDIAYIGTGVLHNVESGRNRIQTMKNPSDPSCIGWKVYGRQVWATSLAYILTPSAAKKLLDVVHAAGFGRQVDHFMVDQMGRMKLYMLEGILCYSPWLYKSDIVH